MNRVQHAKPGDWVQIRRVVLNPGERAPQVPADTAQVPLELRIKGFAQGEAEIGQEIAIRTLLNRTEVGTLEEVWPRHSHDFGRPIPELLTIGQEVKEFLGKRPGEAGHKDGEK